MFLPFFIFPLLLLGPFVLDWIWKQVWLFLHIHTRKRVNSKDGRMVAVGCHFLTLFDRHFMCRYWNRTGFDWTPPSRKPLKKIKLKMWSVCFSSLYFPPVHTVSPRQRAIIDVTYVCHMSVASSTFSFSLIYTTLSSHDLGPPCSHRLIMTPVITRSGNFPKCLASSTVMNIHKRKSGINMHHIY